MLFLVGLNPPWNHPYVSIIRKEVEQFRCPHEFGTSILKNDKQFKCSNCGYKITVPHSKIETNKQIIEKLNKLKPSNKTKSHNNHCWTRDLNYHMIHRSIVYQCPLCGEAERFYTEDKKTLEKIEDTVRQELGLKYTILCNNIELYFYHHRNENVRIKDLAGIYNEFRRTIHLKVQDPEDFVYDVFTIVDIQNIDI